jgi:hypothetical protein
MAESAATLLQQTIPKALPQPQPSPKPQDTAIPAAANPAIAYCLQAYEDAFHAYLRKDDSVYRAEKAANTAYRNALPPLSGSRNIRNFVACIAHAMAIDIISASQGPRLLYAAQVASVAQSTQRRIKAKSAKSSAINTP